ncbi:unnamed protein product [Ilex paraguariensis]|uniref:F-box domain-containing protein n=1 Tax=Ilex paraguariensis TaxID=185542 RepID=A0ABC8REC6_9AQUA
MENISTFSSDFSSLSLFVALIVTVLCCFSAVFAVQSFRFKKSKPVQSDGANSSEKSCKCACSCKGVGGGGNFDLVADTAHLNGGTSGAGEMVEKSPVLVPAEQQSGASMMEQLVPEITTHALSYLDYPSLCRLSMTNSLMRKAANDDNAWKALYHKDFTLEQDSITPVNGWKAYYAATRAIMSVNNEFYNIIRGRSLPQMGRLWFNADYVKCVHASGELFTGYNAVMESWQIAFNWEQAVDFQIRDVRARVLTGVAWVTMKAYVDVESGPFHVTNVFEFHNGRWYMVHHHSSVMLNGEAEQQILLG